MASDGSGCCGSDSDCDCDSSTRFFLRSRLPPRLLPPSTHSRLSRLHRRHGIELSESLQRHVRFTYDMQAHFASRHKLSTRKLQFKQAPNRRRANKQETISHLQQTPTLPLPAVQTRNLRPLDLRSFILIRVGGRLRASRLLWGICFHASSRSNASCRCLKLSGIVGTLTKRGDGNAGIGYCWYRAEVLSGHGFFSSQGHPMVCGSWQGLDLVC